ncbi:hypothetical protein JCM10295v2_003289 [Rhodotorula toruloides]
MAGAPAGWSEIAVAKVEEELVVVEGLGGRRAGLLWVKVDVLAVLALASQPSGRHQAQFFRLIHSAPSSFVYIFRFSVIMDDHRESFAVVHPLRSTGALPHAQLLHKQAIEKEDTRSSGA